MPGVQHLYLLHFLFGKYKIKNIQIFFHPLGIRGLDQRYNITLCQPAQNHLRRGLPVCGANVAERLIMEQIILPCGQRRPRLHLNPLRFQIGHLVLSLKKRIAFQ